MNDQHPAMKKKQRSRLIIFGSVAVAIVVAGLLAAYLIVQNTRVYIENASVSAPLIDLSPMAAGRLNAVYVNPGDTVSVNAPVALVGTQVVKAKISGLIVAVTDTVGAQVNPGETVVTMIDPSQLRVVGQIDENKGLDRIHIGNPVVFTVDAYGSQQFTGIVDEIAPTSNASDIVFSVSNAREEQTFDIKARFDTTAYSYLKNGMSARMWIYTAPPPGTYGGTNP